MSRQTKLAWLPGLLAAMAILILSGCQGNAPTAPPERTAPVESQPAPALATSPATAAPSPVVAQPTPTGAPTQAEVASTPTQEQPAPPVVVATQAVGPLPSPVVTQPTDCYDQAAYIGDVTIPDDTMIQQGDAFVKTWRVRNSGTCPWNAGYAIVFAGDDIMNGSLSNPMPEVSPGEIADISLTLTAPARGGSHTGYWMFQNAAGQRFGTGLPPSGKLWVQINVPWVGASAPTGGEASPPTTGGDCAVQRNSDYENQIVALVNQARQANGLSPLSSQSQLSAAALEHSTDMACKGYVDHVGSDGSTWYDRVGAQGYSNQASARENIYVGDPAFGGDAQGAFDWWMNSQVHRDNILFTNVSEIGVGYVYLPGSPYGGYYTLVLAKP